MLFYGKIYPKTDDYGQILSIFVLSLTLYVTKVTKLVNNMAIEKKYYSFMPGLDKIAKSEYSKIQTEIILFLGCSKQDYYRKRNCYVNIPAHVKEGIEAIFKKYQIDEPECIWEIKSSGDKVQI